MDNMPNIETIDAYIATFPAPMQKILESVRKAIRNAAPDAVECISYKMPTYKQNGNLVHFAGYEHHVGFYPAPDAVAAFANEIAGYKSAKGSIQFPLDKPMPLDLIGSITKFRVMQVEGKLKASKSKLPKRAAVKDFRASLSAPAQRALANEGITTLKQLSKYSEGALLRLHGFGKASLPPLRAALADAALSFKE